MTTPLRQRADESLRVDVPDWTISQVGRAFAHPVGTHTGRENVLYSLEAAERAVELLVEVPDVCTSSGIEAVPPHDFNTGGEIGSASAASTAFAVHIGMQFKRVVNALTVA